MFDFDVRSGNDQNENQVRASLARLQAQEQDCSDPIAKIPRRPPVVVAPSWTVRDAFRLMADRHASTALVASHGVLLGMLSEREIVRRLLEPGTEAGDMAVWKAMVSEPETLLETDTVAYAIRKIWTLGGRAMPILQASGAVFGVLETQDLVSWMCGRVGTGPQMHTGPE